MRSILILFIVLVTSPFSFADSWTMRPDEDFHAHPLFEISASSMVFARAEVVKVLRPSTRRKSGLLKVMMASGSYRGQVLYAKNFPQSSHVSREATGVNVIVTYLEKEGLETVYIDSYDRIGSILIMLFIFIAMVALVGRKRSLYSLLSLIAAVILIKFLYLPLIFQSGSLILYTFVLLLIIVTVTILAITGFTVNSLISIGGSFAGLIFLYLVSAVFYRFANISGFYMEEIQLLNFLSPAISHRPLSFFRDFLISVSLLGSTGLIMDVAVTISSSIRQMILLKPEISRKELIKRSRNIGSDVISTMSNTLIFAYIGVAFASIIARTLHVSSLFQLANLESVHIDLYRAFFGSAAYIGCVLFTVYAGSYFLKKSLTKK